jgi:peptidoglycan/LPS O-acetylase OafA/YrhL
VVRGGSFGYAPGLDGVRALAVLGVFAYHLGTTSETEYLRGGFLGVDVFFVLSGYLITGLLLAEIARRGRISIKKFYLRRARRLLPALSALLLTVGTIGAVWLPQQASRIRGDLAASLAYVTNWWLIAQKSSYFGTGDRPSMLTHLWSLAVEEQFYLVWPLVLAIVLRRSRRYTLLLAVTIALIIASATAAVLLYDPWADPSRVYYGTDTRAATPLIGAALAIILRPWTRGPTVTGHGRAGRRLGWDLLGLAGLAGLGVVAYRLTDRDPLLYQGGFAVIALLAAAVVASAGQPASRFGRVLGLAPLRWLGQRSYAVYLWHWPVCVLTRPGIDVPITGWANVGLRLAIALALAEVSYWLIERPVRSGTLFRRSAPFRPRLVSAALLSVLLVSGCAVSWQLAVNAAATPALAADGVPVDDPAATLAPATLQPSTTASRSPRPTPVSVAIFGDSQGSALFANKPRDIGSYLTLSNQAINACGIMRGKVVSRTGERLDLIGACPNWLPTWRSRAAAAKAQIALVIIGAWDLFDVTLPKGGKLIFGTPEWDAAWMDQLRSGVAAIRESGSQVALAELPCYRPVKIPGGAGYWPERGDDDRTRHVNELMRQVADGVHVFTVQPAAEFCTDPTVGNNRKNRYDGVHFLGPGAAIYLNTLIPQLLTLPT